MYSKFTINIPATTANIGPGFDCLGMALDLWNKITVEKGFSEFTIKGYGENDLPTDKTNLIYQSFILPFLHTKETIPNVKIKCYNQIPIARGLGSSSAAIVGGLLAGNNLLKNPLSNNQLLQLASKQDGHPDNVAATIYGNCQLVIDNKSSLFSSNITVPSKLKAICFIPDNSMSTNQARKLLPKKVNMKDAVHNISRTSLLIKSFITNDLTNLSIATEDKLHQPVRAKLYPQMNDFFKTLLIAGARSVFLSGSGPTIIALADEKIKSITYQIRKTAKSHNINGDIRIVSISEKGAHIKT
ncbi:MAG: homoserine kinase [Chloroflexota bacterium]|nr:homoserine kinase [SAR202 cluster bacterium]GIT15705.1 MAG: homoserine kinase [Chloroflexota bacterium]